MVNGTKQAAWTIVASAAAAAVAALLGAPQQARATIVINEVMTDAPGVNATQDFIELRSTTGGVESVSDLTMLYIEGEAGAVGGSGAIDNIVTFSGSTGTNGLFLRHSFNDGAGTEITPSPAPAPETTQQYGGWAHENAAITYILVSGFNGKVGEDIDQNDDGVIDYTPWTSVVDAFGYADGDAYDKIYGAALGFTDFSDQVQATNISTVFRSPDGVFHSARLATAPIGGPYATNSSRTVENGFTLTPGNANVAPTTAYRGWVAATPGANWSQATNWAGGVAPNAIDDIAMFDGSATNVINLDVDATVGRLSLGGGNQTIAAGGGTLTMNSAGTPVILLNYGNATIAAPIALAKTTQVWVGGGQSLTTSGISGTGNLDKRAGGFLRLTGTNTYNGNTVITTGTIIADSPAALPGWDVAGKVSAGAAGTLSVSAGGAGQWSTADIDTVIATTTFNAASRFGFNVDAGNTYTHPTGISKAVGISKVGGGELVLEGANTYTGPTEVLQGTLKLTAPNQLPANALTVSGAAATLNLNGNDLTAGTVNVSQGGTITGAGTLTGSSFSVARGAVHSVLAGGALTKTGPFPVTLTAANTYTGGTSLNAGPLSISSNANLGDISGSLTFNGGTLQVTGTGLSDLGARPVNWDSFNGGVDVDEAAHTFSANAGVTAPVGSAIAKTGAGTFAVNYARGAAVSVDQGTLKILPDGTAAGAGRVEALTIAPGARLDLTNNKLVTATPAGTATGGVYAEGSVHRMVQTAYQESSWSGPGLTTSMEDATTGLTTIAIATGEQIGRSDFAGQQVGPTDTVAFYTYGGDTNFDGKLDADDYGTIDFNVLLPGPIDGYYNGDFNYDGVVNADDYGVIDFNILAQTTPFPTGGDATVSGVTAVPEPSAFGVALGAAALLGVRRRRTR